VRMESGGTKVEGAHEFKRPTEEGIPE
jgi:hypothetical protein